MNIDDLRVVVTGGAGFIGSRILDDRVHRGASVRVCNDASWGQEAERDPVRRDVDMVAERLSIPELRMRGHVDERERCGPHRYNGERAS